MVWFVLIGVVIAIVVALKKLYNEANTGQVPLSTNRPVISQSVESSKISAADAFTSDERFEYGVAQVYQHMNSIKDLRLRHTGYMLKYIKKEPEFNTGYVAIYTRIDDAHPRILQQLRNGAASRTADERIAIEDEIIRDISELSVEEFRKKFAPDFLFDYLEPYDGDWSDDSYELNFEVNLFMPEGSLTPYEMYKEYEKALYKMEQQPVNKEG